MSDTVALWVKELSRHNQGSLVGSTKQTIWQNLMDQRVRFLSFALVAFLGSPAFGAPTCAKKTVPTDATFALYMKIDANTGAFVPVAVQDLTLNPVQQQYCDLPMFQSPCQTGYCTKSWQGTQFCV